VEAAVLGVGGHGQPHPALAQVAQRVALPLLDLAPVLEQPVCAQARDQATEAAAGID
jgi:hypothetical protein